MLSLPLFSGTLRKSRTYEKLENLVQGHNSGLYSDPAYLMRPLLLKTYSTTRITPSQYAFNKRMSAVRQAVESGCGKIAGLFAFLDLCKNDVSPIFKNCYFLLLANDVEVFKFVSYTASCSALQREISSFLHWCSCNRLLTNTFKTKVMTYTRKTNSILFPYNINGEVLPRVMEVNDVGVYFDGNLTVSPRIQLITHTAL